MKEVLVLLILFIAAHVIAQDDLSRQTHLNDKEFAELIRQRDQFVPGNLHADTVIVVRYRVGTLEQMQQSARNQEWFKNGEDTTEYVNGLPSTPKQLERKRRYLVKFSKDFPEEQAAALEKKGVKTLIVDEASLKDQKRYRNKYWLKTTYICIQDGYRGSWILLIGSVFYDPVTRHTFKALPYVNHTLPDLVD